MYCENCGNVINENDKLCTNCGVENSGTINSQDNNTIIQSEPMITETDLKNSYFDGGFWGLLGVNILSKLLTIISLGFAWPAMYCFKLRWIYKHTCVGGYRLKFNGRGIQLFGKYILWTFLSIITIGIYALWLPIKYKKWEISHVEIDKQF